MVLGSLTPALLGGRCRGRCLPGEGDPEPDLDSALRFPERAEDHQSRREPSELPRLLLPAPRASSLMAETRGDAAGGGLTLGLSQGPSCD